MPNLDITEEWLIDVLDDSMEMGWTTADGARAIMRALEVSFGYRPPSGDQGSVAVGQATQPLQVGDTDAGEVIERPSVQGKAEGVVADHPVQVACDSVSTLPPITFSEQEATALATALARPRAAVGEREREAVRDDVADLLHKVHWEAWKAGVFTSQDEWPEEDEQAELARGVDSVAVGEHFQAWCDEIVDTLTDRILALQSPPAKVEGCHHVDCGLLYDDGPEECTCRGSGNEKESTDG